MFGCRVRGVSDTNKDVIFISDPCKTSRSVENLTIVDGDLRRRDQSELQAKMTILRTTQVSSSYEVTIKIYKDLAWVLRVANRIVHGQSAIPPE